MLLRDLEDFKKWKKSMENKTPSLNAISGNIQAVTNLNPNNDNDVHIATFQEHSVIYVTSTGPSGVYYSSNVVDQIIEKLKQQLAQEKSLKNYYLSRSDNIQTAYNLQKKALENADKKVEGLEEKIKILSDALTRSKMNERGKLILISRLKNQLNKHGRSKR